MSAVSVGPAPDLLLRNVRLLDPYLGLDRVADVWLQSGVVRAITIPGTRPVASGTPLPELAADGLWLMPTLVDASVRVRQPSQLAHELQAALAGGVADVLLMPDTRPVLDEPGVVEQFVHSAQALGLARLHVAGALTQGLEGRVLSEMGALAEAGCCAFAQADSALPQSQVLERALQYAASFGFTVCLQPSKPSLSLGAVVAEGVLALHMGLPGVPVAAETLALQELIALVRRTGVRLHVSRLSAAASLPLLRSAKAEGLPISADIDVFHLHLDERAIGYFDSRLRLCPPLRHDSDRLALADALAEGTIDLLVSDHAFVSSDAKIQPFASSSPGGSSVDLFASLWWSWAAAAKLSPLAALACVTRRPAALLGAAPPTAQAAVASQSLAVGSACTACLFDPRPQWRLQRQQPLSAGRFTPFEADVLQADRPTGFTLQGRVCATWVAGRLRYQAPEFALPMNTGR